VFSTTNGVNRGSLTHWNRLGRHANRNPSAALGKEHGILLEWLVASGTAGVGILTGHLVEAGRAKVTIVADVFRKPGFLRSHLG
jgi:hypothetical protein